MNSKTKFIISIIVFRLLLDLSYFLIISKSFGYMGFNISFLIVQYALSWIIYIGVANIIPNKLEKISDYFFATALLSVLAPLSCIYGFDTELSIYPLTMLILALSIIWIITENNYFNFSKFRIVKFGKSIAVITSFLFVVSLVCWYYMSGVVFNLDFSKVYDYRSENAKLSTFGFLAYTNIWTFKIFNVFLMCLALKRRRFIVFSLLFVVQIYFFAASAHKSVLFYPFLVVGIWLYFRKTNSLSVLPVMFSVVILCSILTFYIFDDMFLSSFFSRRVFFIPAKLAYDYYDFFSINPKIFWSNSLLSTYIEYPYDVSMSKVIGRHLGKPDMAANNGFVSSGYAHAGIYGVIIYSIIIGIILRFVDEMAKGYMPIWFTVSLTVIPLRNLLISSDLLTTLLTHGFLVAILLLYLYRTKNSNV